MYGLIEVIPIKKNGRLNSCCQWSYCCSCLQQSYCILFLRNWGKNNALKKNPQRLYDNRISPDINQGLTVEVLRIRNRSLLERMLGWVRVGKIPRVIIGSSMLTERQVTV